MNNYPKWWNQTLTIYNKSTNATDGSISWSSFVVDSCFWRNLNNRVVVGSTTIDTDSIICRIPKSDNFVNRYTYDNLTSDKKSKYFTLSPGDIIVLGKVTEAINEYTAGQRSSDFINKYRNQNGCMQIEAYSANIGDRGLEHYYVRGI